MNLQCVGHIDAAPVIAAVHGLSWSEEAWRRHMPFSPHRDSDTIMLRGPSSVKPRAVLNSIEVVNFEPMTRRALGNAVWKIAGMAGKAPARAMLTQLAPGGRVTSHVDCGRYADLTDRYHAALETNQGAWLQVEDERVFMRAGEVWFLDKHKPHRGANEGEAPRTHLIVDVWRSA